MLQLKYNIFIINIKYRFTCDESNLYQDVAKIQNIRTRIVGLLVLARILTLLVLDYFITMPSRDYSAFFKAVCFHKNFLYAYFIIHYFTFHPAFTCSQLKIKTLEQGVKYVQS